MQKLFKDTIGYVVLNYLSLFITMVRGILLINILTPASLGVYKLLFTYSSYFRYYNLGLNALAFYRAPSRGLQDTYSFLLRKINILLAWSFGILFTIIFSIFWWQPLSELGSLDFILWLFGILYFTQVAETYITISKIKKDFRVVNIYNIQFAAVSTVMMIGLGYFLELRGVIIGLAISTVIASLYVMNALKLKLSVPIKLSAFRIKTLFKHSVITILPGMFIVLFSTIEIWIIAYSFGAEETGFYSMVTTFINIILMLNTDGIVFLYSRKSMEFRKDPGFVLKLTAVAFILITLVCFAGTFVVDWGIETFFPKYLRSAEIYKLCFWGIPFLVARNVVVSYISMNRSILISMVLLVLLIMKTLVLFFIYSPAQFYIVLAATNVMFGVVLTTFYLYNGRNKLTPQATISNQSEAQFQ
jgi:O-antigen/teichoic acid export membrane protein